MTLATPASVMLYLNEECGITTEKAAVLVKDYDEVIQKGSSMGSYAYYVGNEILELAAKDCGGGIPEDWYEEDWLDDEDEEWGADDEEDENF